MMQNHQIQKSNIDLGIGGFISSVVTDMKSLKTILTPISKQKTETTNTLVNKLLAPNQDLLQLIQDVLQFIVTVVDLKSGNVLILSILAKVISTIKTLETDPIHKKTSQKDEYSKCISKSLSLLIEIILQLKNNNKQIDMILRIIQTTLSLIDINLLQYSDHILITRMYSICFDCSLTNAIIQSISTSALEALTEIVFASHRIENSLLIITELLEYLFKNKKVEWIKSEEQVGLVWDLIIIGVRHFPTNKLDVLGQNKTITELMNHMYSLSIQQVFDLAKETIVGQNHKSMKSIDSQKNTSLRKSLLNDFMRYYKTYVYFSIHLAIKIQDAILEIVPFRDSLHHFKSVYNLERSNRLYIFTEGVSLLIIEGSDLLIKQERALVLIDLFSKIAQQLSTASIPIEISWEGGDFYLQKMCGDLRKIADSDFIKIIKNTIIRLRKKLQPKNSNKNLTEQQHSVSELEKTQIDLHGSNVPNSSSKRWQKLIKTVIRIIRYLTSLNLKIGYNDQVVRKLIIQLQSWLLICPSYKTRNMILHQWLSTSSHLDTKMQAIKVSQCLQLGSNIIFAYSHILDNVGLSILIKMLASVRVSWEQGKGFDQLDEVCLMSDRLYSQQNLIHSYNQFTKTIQGFVQCCNSLLADMQQPIHPEQRRKKTGRNPIDKLIKMIDYVLSKLKAVLLHSVLYVQNQWNFLTAFWISFCSSKNQQIRLKTMNHMWYLFPALLKKGAVRQDEILSPYLQLAKFHHVQTSKLIIAHIKQLLVSFTYQSAIMQAFAIIKVILQTNNPSLQISLYELQQMLVKQSIYRVKAHQNIESIIDSLFFLSKDTNQQYMTVSLLWNISDHIKALNLAHSLDESQNVWKHLFNKINSLAVNSKHAQTKQSCIHALTQIMAESTSVLGPDFFFQITQNNFLQLFYFLMNIEEKTANSQHIEMAHAAIKNYIKLIKKCIADKMTNLNILLELSTQRMLQIITTKGKLSTVQYYYEVCILLQFWNYLQTTEENRFNSDNFIKLVQQMEINQQAFDKTSLIWRKKYQPMFSELKELIIKQ